MEDIAYLTIGLHTICMFWWVYLEWWKNKSTLTFLPPFVFSIYNNKINTAFCKFITIFLHWIYLYYLYLLRIKTCGLSCYVLRYRHLYHDISRYGFQRRYPTLDSLLCIVRINESLDSAKYKNLFTARIWTSDDP